MGANIANYRSYPRIVGETGGKDFIVAHPSADPDVARVAMLRGAFEFQGQKCSAASRAYVARSVWDRMKDEFLAEVEAIAMGDVTDFSNFMGAVIDDRAFAKHRAAIERAKRRPPASRSSPAARSTTRSATSCGPTVIEGGDPTDEMFATEYFGPILAVHVYEDGDFETVVAQLESFAPYALTGAVIAQDRRAIAWAQEELRFAAGNFYINDKPTGAVVGQQPFGGGRASGTNDKAGAAVNLLRWTRRGRSRRRSCRRRTTATRTWAELPSPHRDRAGAAAIARDAGPRGCGPAARPGARGSGRGPRASTSGVCSGVEGRVVRVALGAAAVEGVGVRLVQRGAGLPAGRQVGVGEEQPADRDRVGEVLVEDRLRLLAGGDLAEAVVGDDTPPKSLRSRCVRSSRGSARMLR